MAKNLFGILKEWVNKPSTGFWNGAHVEFGKVYANPMLNAFSPINEDELPKGKKLRVFDFDDTLVNTKSHVYVTHGDGKKSSLTPGEYAIYEPKKDDQFDFSDFQKVNQPQEIKGVTKLLRNVIKAEGERKTVILTARSAYKPVKDYLKDIGIDGVYVVALADADPQKKADWISDKIKSGYNDVFFIDDSHKNVAAVGALKKKHPEVKLKVRTVRHEMPAMPNMVSKEDDKNKAKSSTDISKLKSMMPKSVLDKKVKNPDTGRQIKVTSALGYDKDSQVYKAAASLLKRK
jgi:phosphoglycolate phosphatase-like HAD superfamily hydrolase